MTHQTASLVVKKIFMAFPWIHPIGSSCEQRCSSNTSLFKLEKVLLLLYALHNILHQTDHFTILELQNPSHDVS